MIIDEFHFIFDKCKRKIEFYMSYYNGSIQSIKRGA